MGEIKHFDVCRGVSGRPLELSTPQITLFICLAMKHSFKQAVFGVSWMDFVCLEVVSTSFFERSIIVLNSFKLESLTIWPLVGGRTFSTPLCV